MGLGIFDSLINPIADVVKDVVDRQVIDKAGAEKLKNELNAGIVQAAEAANLEQIKVNEAEAQSKNIFIAGWRPGIGWSCALAFFSNYVLAPFVTWGTNLYNHIPAPYPLIDMTTMLPVLLGLLGLGGYRTFDKYIGKGNGD